MRLTKKKKKLRQKTKVNIKTTKPEFIRLLGAGDRISFCDTIWGQNKTKRTRSVN